MQNICSRFLNYYLTLGETVTRVYKTYQAYHRYHQTHKTNKVYHGTIRHMKHIRHITGIIRHKILVWNCQTFKFDITPF